MPRSLPLLVLAIVLLAGCSTPAMPSTPTSTTTPPTTLATPTPIPDPASPVSLVEVDGRWGFPEAEARAMLGGASTGAGALWLGESRVAPRGPSGRPVAGAVAAFDANATALLDGGPRPARGEVWLSQNASARLGVAVGDEVDLASYAWPRSRILVAYEMERVRACDARAPAPLCILPSRGSDGSVELALDVPPGASDLLFNPDVVELAPRDFPAEWNGSFVAPSGAVTPFATGARSRADVDPPGGYQGPVESGRYVVRFTIRVNGTLAPNAVAGLITFRAPGYTSFAPDLLRVPDAVQQTRRLLENGTRHDAAGLRVAGTFDPSIGAPALVHAVAVISPDDAVALFDVGEGNATALVAPTRAGLANAVARAAGQAADPALQQLRARAARALPAMPASDRLWWAPPDLDAARGALTVEGALPLGAPLVVGTNASARGTRVLALPAPAAPWPLVPKAFWPNVSAAYEGIGRGPHLVLLGEDLARDERLDPHALAYTQLSLDGATGSRVTFAMGAVGGVVPRAVWESAALLAASGRVVGARWIGTADAAPAGVVELLSEG